MNLLEATYTVGEENTVVWFDKLLAMGFFSEKKSFCYNKIALTIWKFMEECISSTEFSKQYVTF